jgi:hypothetical protein
MDFIDYLWHETCKLHGPSFPFISGRHLYDYIDNVSMISL